MGNEELEDNVADSIETEQRLRDKAMRLGHPVPIVKRLGDGQIVYGTINSNGVIQGKRYEEGQNPEDGPTGDYSNVPFNQHDDRD